MDSWMKLMRWMIFMQLMISLGHMKILFWVNLVAYTTNDP